MPLPPDEREALRALLNGQRQAALDAEWYLRDTPPEARWLKPDEIEAEAERIEAEGTGVPAGRMPL